MRICIVGIMLVTVCGALGCSGTGEIRASDSMALETSSAAGESEAVMEEAIEEAVAEVTDIAHEVIQAIPDAAIGKQVTLSCPPNRLYPAAGAKSLVDGRMGSEDYYDPEWMGWWYEDKPFEATVDLGRVVSIQELGVHVLTLSESWILYPRSVEFAVSKDGELYKELTPITPTDEELSYEYPATTILKATGLDEEARFIRVRAKRYGELPEWHLGHGGGDGYEGEAWLFIDEILVNAT